MALRIDAHQHFWQVARGDFDGAAVGAHAVGGFVVGPGLGTDLVVGPNGPVRVVRPRREGDGGTDHSGLSGPSRRGRTWGRT